MNAAIVAIAVVLTVLILPFGSDLVIAGAAVAWGIALFGLVSDALDGADGMVWVRGLLVFSVALTLVFAWLGGLLGFLLLGTALSLSFACSWQRQRMIR